MNEYSEMEKGGKAASDGFREGGKSEKAKAPSYKEGPNPNVNVPKLPQVKGAEQG